jgi:hypothetical protein
VGDSFLPILWLTLQPTESASDGSLGWSGERNPRTAHEHTCQPVQRATEPTRICRPRCGLDRLMVGVPGVPLPLHPRLHSHTRFAGWGMGQKKRAGSWAMVGCPPVRIQIGKELHVG